MCRCLNAISAGSQVDCIQIVFKNYIFVIDVLLDLNSKILFLDLALQFVDEGCLTRPLGKHSVLQKLLCDRTGTLGKITAGSDAGNAGTDDTGKVDTIVLVKTGIFECNKGMLQIDRYLIDCYIFTV